MCPTIDPDYRSENGTRITPLSDSHAFTVDEERGVLLSLVEEMAAVLGCTMADLDPLYTALDPEILERIVDGHDETEVGFVNNGIYVTVHGDGRITFTPARR